METPVTLDLKSSIDLKQWIRAEVKFRAADKKFNFIKFDFLMEMLSERVNVALREKYSILTELWQKTPGRQYHISAEEMLSRFESLQKLFSEKEIPTELTGSSTKPDKPSWTMNVKMKNITFELTPYAEGRLKVKIPYHYFPYLDYHLMPIYPGVIPYTDEQLIQVLLMADNAIPDIETEVMKYVTSRLAQKVSKNISNISTNAAIRKTMDETGLSYSAKHTSKGIKVSILTGDNSHLFFRTNKYGENLTAEMVLEAAEAADKIIRILGPSAALFK